MKKEVFRIIRGYRKSFAMLATKYPNEALDYWFMYYHKTDGVMGLFSIDNSVSLKEYMLINRYFAEQWQRLYTIYCQ